MNAPRPALPWSVNLVAIGCALFFGELVEGSGWPMGSALFLVVAGGVVLSLLLFFCVLVFAGRGNRSPLWRSFLDAVRRDWQALVHYFRGHP